MLQAEKGDRIHIEQSTLEQLVADKLVDPELLRLQNRRRQLERLGLVIAGADVMARFEPGGHVAGVDPPPHVMAAPYPGAVVNPLSPPTVSTTTFTVDLALKNPTRVITPIITDLTVQRFFVDRAFTSAGGVTGGAVVYDPVAIDLYSDRDVQRIAPGAEFPEVSFSRRAPQVAAVEKWGGKFYFTDEARDRNDIAQFTNAMRQLSNTVVRKINQRGVEILEAAITANSRSVSGNSWGSVVTAGATPSNFTAYPARDFARADLVAEQEELGMDYNLWVLNPSEMFNLEGIYGDRLGALLDSFDIDIFVTNRVTAGIAYALAEGQVGEMRIEQPLQTETWRDPNGKQQTWVQSSVRPVMYANNPFAVLKFTGLT